MPSRFTLKPRTELSRMTPAWLKMMDDALAEEFWTDGFEDAGERVVAGDAFGEGDSIAEPCEPDFAELLHELVGFHAAENTRVGFF